MDEILEQNFIQLLKVKAKLKNKKTKKQKKEKKSKGILCAYLTHNLQVLTLLLLFSR